MAPAAKMGFRSSINPFRFPGARDGSLVLVSSLSPPGDQPGEAWHMVTAEVSN